MNSRSGLSLFELLVALALLALIATGLAGTMGLAVNMWDRSASLSASAEEIALRSRLRIWLRNAVPPSRLMPFPTDFEGSEDGFSFVTLSETPFAPDAAALRVTVSLTDTNLVLQADGINEDGETITSFEGIVAKSTSAKLSYYSLASGSIGWRKTWTETNQLPGLILIEVPTTNAAAWPNLVGELVSQ